MVRFNGIAMAFVVAVISACLTLVFSQNPLLHRDVQATAEPLTFSKEKSEYKTAMATAEPTTKPVTFTGTEGQTEALAVGFQWLPDGVLDVLTSIVNYSESSPHSTVADDQDHSYLEFENKTIVNKYHDDEKGISAVPPLAMRGVNSCKSCHATSPDAVWCAPQTGVSIGFLKYKFEIPPTHFSGGCFPKGTDCNKVVFGTLKELLQTNMIPLQVIKTHYSVTAIPKDDEACTDVVWPVEILKHANCKECAGSDSATEWCEIKWFLKITVKGFALQLFGEGGFCAGPAVGKLCNADFLSTKMPMEWKFVVPVSNTWTKVAVLLSVQTKVCDDPSECGKDFPTPSPIPPQDVCEKNECCGSCLKAKNCTWCGGMSNSALEGVDFKPKPFLGACRKSTPQHDECDNLSFGSIGSLFNITADDTDYFVSSNLEILPYNAATTRQWCKNAQWPKEIAAYPTCKACHGAAKSGETVGWLQYDYVLKESNKLPTFDVKRSGGMCVPDDLQFLGGLPGFDFNALGVHIELDLNSTFFSPNQPCPPSADDVHSQAAPKRYFLH